MKLSREVGNSIRFILDNLIPPIIRDSKWFIYLPFKLFYGKNADIFFNFKKNAPFMSKKEFSDIYKRILPALPDRDTDLNKACFKSILKNIKGKSVLEVGCGNCFLSSKIEKKGFNITASDIVINDKIKKTYPNLTFKNADVESLPFKKNQFDTVICAHTIEHVIDLVSAIKELRRICSKRLIVVVPKQKPFKYTFDLHLHFFPYKHSVNMLMQNKKSICKVIGGDIFYMEDLD